jgi:hypothetical protein
MKNLQRAFELSNFLLSFFWETHREIGKLEYSKLLMSIDKL